MAGKSGYDVYVDKCLLPVTPQKLDIKINNANKTMVLMDEGQINILKKAELTDIEFECMIPQVQYPFAVYKSGFKGAAYYLDYFEELKISQKPFQFIVSRSLPNGKNPLYTNMKVSLEDYKITEDAKNGFDLMVKMKLKQYRDYGTKILKADLNTDDEATASVQTARETEHSPEPKTVQTYTVVSGDTLWAIGKRFYGDGAKYTVIHHANKDKISNPNLIYPGQIITIPAL